MSENNNGTNITLPDGASMTYEECLDNLKHTRDFDLYLDMLNVFKDKYLIILCIRETSCKLISETSLEKIHSLGFSDYKAAPNRMYVGISDKGNIICNEASDKFIRFRKKLGSTGLLVTSEQNAAEIAIDDEDHSLNSKGLNFAVYDLEKSEITDVSWCDEFNGKVIFFHRNFMYSDEYIDSHIYMPKRHMDSITPPIKRSCFSNRKLNVQEVERGIILPNKRTGDKTYGGVCDENFNFISGHQVFSPGADYLDNRHHIVDSYTVPSKNIEYMDETVVYGGTMTDHPGHIILESFADRIWWFIKNAGSSLKIAVTTALEHGLKQSDAYFIKQYIDTFGIPEDRIVFVRKPMQFKKIIIPDQSEIPINGPMPYEFTAEYIQAFRQMTKQLSPAKYKKLYLTKRQAAKSNIIGEDYFIDFFEKKGFKIIHPEDHTIKETAEIMYGADEVVTLEGTNAHFAVFCKPSVRLTILTRMYNCWVPSQQLVNEAVGIKDFFLVNASGNFISNDIFTDGFNRFHDGIVRFAHCLNLICVTEEFKKYVKDVYNEELDITPEESLKNVLYEYLAYFPEFYSTHPIAFKGINDLRMIDILRNMSEVFHGKEFDTSQLGISASEDQLRLREQERILNIRKVNDLTSQVNALTEENNTLKKYLKYSVDNFETQTGQQGKEEHNKLQAELLAVYRQKDETEEKLLELYSRIDDLTKQLLQVTEEKSALAAYIAGIDQSRR